MKIIFAHPIYLWILPLLPILVLAYIFVFRSRRPIALKFSNFEALEKVAGKSFVPHYSGFLTSRELILLLFRTATYLFFILALSGMVIEYYGDVSNFDFVLTIDSSSSMLADDFNPNRLESAKESALLFADSVAKQTNIGIVSFGGEVFIDLKPTTNTGEVKKVIEGIDIKKIGGTNIGDSLITAANIFEGENPKKIILLTDGQATIGTEPEDAINYLNSKNVTVYTIGVATKEGGNVDLAFVSKLDEETLKKIAEKTGGEYYRAENKDVLKDIFKGIASSTVKNTTLDLSWILLIIAFVILVLEWFLASTRYRMLP